MRITLLGVLTVLAAFLLLAYVGHQIERKWNEAKEEDEQGRHKYPNRNETDSL